MAKSMKYNVSDGFSSLLKDGFKHLEGIDEATAKNIDAVKQLADIVRTSVGPHGMNKLVINHLDKILVTSDTATIVQELEVVHPAAKIVVMAAKMQEDEYGDGTNLTVAIAGELLLQAADLLRMGLHPSDIVIGYEKALHKTLHELDTLIVKTVKDPRQFDDVLSVIRPVISAKQYGYEDILAKLVVEACMNILPPLPKPAKINVDNVRVCKIIGSSIYNSSVLKGMIIQRDAETIEKNATKCKVAVFGCGIEMSSTEAKGTVLLNNADELLNYNKSEEKKLEEAIEGIAQSGVKVLISGGSISEMALHFIDKFHLIAIKITSKWELRRICKASNATPLVRLGAPTAEEMGFCDSVSVQEIGGKKVTVLRQDDEESAISTIVLRGSTENVLNDLERAVNDGINCYKSLCRDGNFIPGAGAVEIELAKRLQRYGESAPGLEQYAIKQFGTAFEIVPRTLADNSGSKSNLVISNLYAAHSKDNGYTIGVDTEGKHADGIVDNVKENGIVDHLLTKKSAIRLGADAAITVLRVDQIIMAKPAGGPKPRDVM